MRRALVVLALLAGVVAVPLLVGSLLSREHVATSAVALRQSPDTVWRVVRDLGGVAAWWSEVKKVERVPDQAGRELWRQTLGSNAALTFVVAAEVPPSRLVTQIDAPRGAPFGGFWVYEIAPSGDGSRVTVTEQGWIANPLFRFLSRVVFGQYGTLDSYLKALGKRFGEDVTPVHLEGPRHE